MKNKIDKREEKERNKKRHEAFRTYYWESQLRTIWYVSLCFLLFSAVSFLVVVPFEHPDNPELGRLKYGTSVIGHIVFAAFSRWLLGTKKIADDKKPVVMECFSFVLGLAYLIWGLLGMAISMSQYPVPIILMYLILLAVITAFLYYPLKHFVWLVVISYSIASVIFVMGDEYSMIDITSSICAVTMMVVLGVLSNNRYRFGIERYEFETKNRSLLEEQEIQNEELEAQNEELIAINTELNETTDKLTKAMEELARTSDAQKRFTNSMNHELRAPLNGIIGTIQVMQMNPQIDETDQRYLDQCMGMAKSLLSIVNDLLDIAKMEAGEFEVFPAPFDLHEVIGNVDATFRNQAENKGLEFRLDIPEDMVCGLYADDFRLQQVITNIVSNGVKYTEKGSVTIKASFEEDTLRFVISDTGQGMSEESLKYLFVPFKRIAEEKNKKIQGTGLGMSIVQNLVKSMKGTIQVDSKLGEGTTFTLTLPSKITDANNTWANPSKKAKSKGTESLINLQGKKILYVDDTKFNLNIISKLLADTGVSMTTTDSSLEGLDLAVQNDYDVIMVDHQMPELSGPELLEEIRSKSEQNQTTPVIVFTGNAGAGAEEQYKEMGFAGYICKPVLKEKLLELLEQVVESSF